MCKCVSVRAHVQGAAEAGGVAKKNTPTYKSRLWLCGKMIGDTDLPKVFFSVVLDFGF